MNQQDYLYILLLFIAVTPFLIIAARAYTHLRRKQQYKKIMLEIENCYSGQDTYTTAKKHRHLYFGYDLVYGEIMIYTLLDLLNSLKPSEHKIFYDLGSGGGKAAFAVKLYFPKFEVTGLELIEPLNAIALHALNRYNLLHAPNRLKDLTFICTDFLKYDFSNADIVFINATGFTDENWQQILIKLNQLKQGTAVITTSKLLPSDTFIQRYGAMEQMHWGLVSTYIYERL